MDLRVLIIVNSASESFDDFDKYILPYIKVFGIPYIIHDRAHGTLSDCNYQLIILGHNHLELSNDSSWTVSEKELLLKSLKKGTGIVSFDAYSNILDDFFVLSDSIVNTSKIVISSEPHYVTALKFPGEVIEFRNEVNNNAVMSIHRVILSENVQNLAYADDVPFIFCKSAFEGRFLQWLSYKWIDPSIRGPLWNMDDLLWRSIVWAAKKPFVARMIPNFATIRVDDCCGDHGYYSENPFQWVDIASEYGFKPWIGFFYEDISPKALDKMRELITEGKITAQFHGVELFGRIFSNDDETTHGILKTIKEWFETVGGEFPLSKYFIPHAYDLTSNAIPVLKYLGVEFIGLPYELDSGGAAGGIGNPWLKAGPYRRHFEGVDGNPMEISTVNRPFYYADRFLESNESASFFNIITEIRDINGYEWFDFKKDDSENIDVDEAIKNGTLILKRCFDSKIFANLFTHEDTWRGKFISNITPKDWRTIIAGVVSNLSSYELRFPTLDEAAMYVRELSQSYIERAEYFQEEDIVRITIRSSNYPTEVTVFSEYSGFILESSYPLENKDLAKEINIKLKKERLPEYNTIFTREFPVRENISQEPLLLGTKFYSVVPGEIERVRFYSASNESGLHQIQILNCRTGEVELGPIYWNIECSASGWMEFKLSEPLKISSNTEYIVFISTSLDKTDKYIYVSAPGYFCSALNREYLRTVTDSGVYLSNFQTMSENKEVQSSFFRDIVFKAII